MFRSGLVKSACVAITLSGLSAPDARAVEMVQGLDPSAGLNQGLISRVVEINRGPAGGVHVHGAYGGGVYRGPRGGVYGHGPVYRGGVYHGGGWGGGYGYGGWARPGWYHWGPGGAIAAGAALGVLATGAAIAYAGQPPAPGLCWYYTDPSYRQGFWDACQ
jgi:hypothetical protein